MTYKFLLFDLDHTLLDFDAAEDVALTQLLKEEGVADIQAYKDYYVPWPQKIPAPVELKKTDNVQLSIRHPFQFQNAKTILKIVY